ncbi:MULTISPECIES: endolytic transglycosylase MltG [Pseudovibrio]|uniref:endolytic transglycosylase MltG n=1 Tax=Stappiaceae TaxID=2821832 RepID=UPI0023662E6A|nr:MULTISPECIES: endolytic transglycosylase MltG [Pseudovibrio]MDD7908910.1 endolytic transglycosylase MltG [Pseudovibrio exalbescens]MDX5593769.1 endolytic transglycosylase MltG [Pseudovibrio sp. SPO723]
MANTPGSSEHPETEDANGGSQQRVNPRSPRQAIQPDKAPPPPTRSRHARNPLVMVINFLLTLAVLGILGAGALVYWGKGEFEGAGPLSETTSVIIPKGASLGSIADRLHEAGVIEDTLVFEAGTRFYKNQNRMKAGEYAFAPGVSMHTVMEDLVEGNAVFHTVTFPEGWTSWQIINRLNADPILVGDITEIPAEGSLLPETYSFTRGTTRQKIIDEMKEGMQRAITQAWERRAQDLPIESPEELVTLASIVEKETSKADERSRVAGVFVNRLRKGMPLQSDPTILYGLFGGEAWTKDRSAITRSQLRQQNPYNTYQINALPPGPIGNPGKAALEATSNPSRTNDLYFVADGTGGHAFAETYKQHQRNVAEWRKIEREIRARQAEQQQSEGE